MNVAIVYGAQCLLFRGDFSFTSLMDDPRGLTGSEYGMIRIAQELAKRHDVTIYAASSETETAEGITVRPVEELKQHQHDVAIAINEPDLLRDAKAGHVAGQARLDEITSLIAGSMGCEVCSIYLFRDPETLELCATKGLQAEAVHQTRMRLGEGLVGRVAQRRRAAC